MAAARALAERIAAAGDPVYGLTTGMGALRGVALTAADVERYSDLTIRAHRTAHGPMLPAEVSRAAMLHRANALARGRSMVRPQVAEAFVDALNDGFAPPLHAIGSVGQTDLPATAELIFGLVEAGRLQLAQGEALATLNANSLSVGVGALALHDMGRLLDAYDVVGALAWRATPATFGAASRRGRGAPVRRHLADASAARRAAGGEPAAPARRRAPAPGSPLVPLHRPSARRGPRRAGLRDRPARDRAQLVRRQPDGGRRRGADRLGRQLRCDAGGGGARPGAAGAGVGADALL